MNLPDLMNGNNLPDLPDIPRERLSYNISNPGLPLPVLINSVALLFDVYNVKHQLSVDIEADFGVGSDNPSIDERFQSDYMTLKMFLDSLNREYQDITCEVKGMGIGLHLIFDCR